jgi:NADH:ubiquinone oxidoreductase subunit E
MTTTESVLPQDIVEYIAACRAREHGESYLITVLQRVQERQGYLTPESMDAVAHLMRIPTATVSGVASFYHFFHFKPRGQHIVTVCMGTACFVRGAGEVLARLEELLGIKAGETTPDGRFSVECARCLGACALAPVVVLDGHVHGNVQVADVRKLLESAGFGA